MPTPTRSAVGDGAVRACLWTLTCLAVAWTAYHTRQIAVPIAFAFLLKVLLSPIVRGLARRGVPRIVSSLVLVVGGVLLLGGAVMTAAPAIVHWTEELPERLHMLEDKLVDLTRPVAAISEATSKVGEKVETITEAATAQDADATPVVRIEEPSWLASVFSTLQQLAVELFLMVALLFLLLLGDGLVLAKMKQSESPNARRWVAALAAIEQRMGLFVRSVVLVHGCVGLLVGTFCWLWGMPNPWLWGAVSAIGNAVPFIGPVSVVGVLTVVSLTSFTDTATALVPVLVYLALHLVENNLATPCLLGRWLSLSPVAIFIALTVMGFLWGIPGLVLAVPGLVVARITSEFVPSMRSVQLLLDGHSSAPDQSCAAAPAAPVTTQVTP